MKRSSRLSDKTDGDDKRDDALDTKSSSPSLTWVGKGDRTRQIPCYLNYKSDFPTNFHWDKPTIPVKLPKEFVKAEQLALSLKEHLIGSGWLVDFFVDMNPDDGCSKTHTIYPFTADESVPVTACDYGELIMIPIRQAAKKYFSRTHEALRDAGRHRERVQYVTTIIVEAMHPQYKLLIRPIFPCDIPWEYREEATYNTGAAVEPDITGGTNAVTQPIIELLDRLGLEHGVMQYMTLYIRPTALACDRKNVYRALATCYYEMSVIGVAGFHDIVYLQEVGPTANEIRYSRIKCDRPMSQLKTLEACLSVPKKCWTLGSNAEYHCPADMFHLVCKDLAQHPSPYYTVPSDTKPETKTRKSTRKKSRVAT